MSADVQFQQTKDRLWVSGIDLDNCPPSHPYFGVETQISDGEKKKKKKKMANEFPDGTSLPILFTTVLSGKEGVKRIMQTVGSTVTYYQF
jgi:hypothetical protein